MGLGKRLWNAFFSRDPTDEYKNLTLAQVRLCLRQNPIEHVVSSAMNVLSLCQFTIE